jgi:phospholipase/carboxylesterase
LETSEEQAVLDAVDQLGPALLRGLAAFEQVQRRLHPPAIASLRQALAEFAPPVESASNALAAVAPPERLADFHAQLGRAALHLREALRLFLDPAAGPDGTMRVLTAMREHCRAQAALYPLRSSLPPVNRYFFEAPVWDRIAALDPEPTADRRVGLHHAHDAPDERGGFTLFVPESYDGAALPLVVALHGGAGHGSDFLWTWVREARSRRFLLLAPTSQGPTWSLMGPDRDAAALDAMVEFVRARWEIDPDRILLTGLSDGATYALLHGLRAESPCTALAPVSGVLHPANFANGNMERARERRIYLVHGALDWMFPIGLARAAAEELAGAGADLEFREIEDLSHTYPREENGRILAWLDPSLALADPAQPR